MATGVVQTARARQVAVEYPDSARHAGETAADDQHRVARIQPGVVQDDLDAVLEN